MHLLRSLDVSGHSISIYLAMPKIKQVLAYYTNVVSNCNQHGVSLLVRTEFEQANNITENLKKVKSLIFFLQKWAVQEVHNHKKDHEMFRKWVGLMTRRFQELIFTQVNSDTIRNYTKKETGWELINIFSFPYWSTCVSCWFSTLNMRIFFFLFPASVSSALQIHCSGNTCYNTGIQIPRQRNRC